MTAPFANDPTEAYMAEALRAKTDYQFPPWWVEVDPAIAQAFIAEANERKANLIDQIINGPGHATYIDLESGNAPVEMWTYLALTGADWWPTGKPVEASRLSRRVRRLAVTSPGRRRFPRMWRR